ncbi:MAG: hypothetical protein Q9173_002767 [Seirophora scorigena]
MTPAPSTDSCHSSCTTTVTTLANAAPYSITSGFNPASTLMISAVPNNSEAANTVGSLFSGAAASSLPVSFGTDFTNPASGSASELPHPTISFLTGSALSSQASLISANAGSSFSYNFTFGPGGVKSPLLPQTSPLTYPY